MLSAGAMRDSLSEDLAAFFTGGLIPQKNSTHTIEIRQPREPGGPVIVAVKDGECAELEMMPRWLFPQHPCGSAEFIVSPGSHGSLTFQHFSFDSAGRPAHAKIAYLGDVQVLAFHADVDFQEVLLPGDSNLFLWPLKAVTSVTTDKGKVTIDNRYSPKK